MGVDHFLDSNLRMKRNELINKTAKYYSEDNSKWIFLSSLFQLMSKITWKGIDGAEIIKSLSASGNEYATFRLAEFYRDGDKSLRIYINTQESFNLYKRVSSSEGMFAKYADLAIGNYYEEGIAVPQNYLQALFFYKKSAFEGDPVGMEKLADLYTSGKIQKNINQAYIWYSLAASSRVYQMGTRAKEIVQKIIIKRDFVATQLNQNQILEAQRKTSLCANGNYNLCQ
jgi:hypothetical protein